jgi:hypothetical protein
VPPARRTATRNAENAFPQTGRAAKKPQIAPFRAEDGPPAKRPEIPENDPENAPPAVKLHEIRNAEKAVTTNGRAAKKPQIPAFHAENGPPDTQPENPDRGDHNAPPDVKSHEIRNAEKAIRKTGRAEKRPQISAFHAENGPPAKEPQIPKGG